MKAPLRLTVALLLAAGLVAGCGRNPGDPLAPAGGSAGSNSGNNDPAEVSGAMAAAPDLIEDGQFESADPTPVGDTGPGGAAAIHPLYFFRNITSVERRFEFAFADTDTSGRPTTAIVTIHKLLRGTFDIAAGPLPEGGVVDTSQVHIIRKPLADHWVRRILLKRVPAPSTLPTADLSRPRWRVAASSGAEVTSRAATTHIVSLEIKTAARDTVITDPLAFFRLRAILRLDPAEEVTLIVTTGRNDDVVVLLRGGLRSKFLNNGDNTYTLAWHAPLRGGLHHVGVNALSNGTLYDDAAPYDSKAWIVPYVVSPTVMAEFIP